MNCEQVLERLPELQEGASDDALRQHLEGCDACREQERLLQASWDLLDAWDADLTPSAGFTARVMHECASDPVIAFRPAAAQWRFVPPTVWSRVAAAVAVVVLGVVLFLPHQQAGGPTVAVRPATSVPTVASTGDVIAMDADLNDILAPAPSSPDELLHDVLQQGGH